MIAVFDLLAWSPVASAQEPTFGGEGSRIIGFAATSDMAKTVTGLFNIGPGITPKLKQILLPK